MDCDLLTKCRTCLSDSHIYHQLYDYVDDNYKILEMLDGIVPQIDIKTSSNYSSLVCQSCVDKLVTGYKFQQLSIKTNKRLHDLMGFPLFENEPILEKILLPSTGADSFKMKLEVVDDACFECEINPEDLKEPSNNDNDLGTGHNTNNDTDSSNEKLSVLKERKAQKSASKSDEGERPSKNNRRKGQFPCSDCNKGFDRLYRLKRHADVHAKLRAYRCEFCKYSYADEKTFKDHMLTHENEDITQSNIEVNNERKDEINIDINEQNYCKEENDIVKDTQTFQCSDCPKCFEKKASLSSHYKVHMNKTKNKSNKDTKSDVKQLKCLKNEIETELDMGKVSKDIVKEKTKLIPDIFADRMEELVANAEWFNNDYDDSDDNSEKNAFTKPGAKYIKNIDFFDTGMGEIEKPNKISGKFPCEVCGKVFDRPYSLRRHGSVHSITRPYECKICKYRFVRVNILKAHMIQHDGDGTGILVPQSRPEGFKCPDCPRRFEKQASLSAHRQKHTRNAAETNYQCMVCKRNFVLVKSLTEHINMKHPEVEKHKCDQCDKTFVLHANLVEHLNRHKGNKNLVCLICEKEFSYTNSLKEHMHKHSGESPYLCPQCGKTFQRASNLRQHMERHTGLKKYQCPECPSRFNCRSDQIKHTSTHTNAKPHACDICESRFTRATSLRKHKILHSGERQFKCNQCSLSFTIIDHLRRHLLTHTGEKPHKCKYCERAYAQSGDLTKHLRTHVGENTYMCDQCPMAFKYQAELKQHQSEHYKMAQKLLSQPKKLFDETQHEIVKQIQPLSDMNEAARQGNIDIKNSS